MTKGDLQGKPETAFYTCCKCKQGNLGRDEVHRIIKVKKWEDERMASLESVEYICLECLINQASSGK